MNEINSARKTISAKEALDLIARGPVSLIDVRSETEFAEGTMPGSQNIPILDDSDRVAVGTTYKKEGRDAAVVLGHELVMPKKDSLVRRWQQALKPGQPHLLFCARGGMRSRFSQNWLAENSTEILRITQGLKGLRQEILAILNQDFPAIILGGLTGTGKTRFARSLAAESPLFKDHWIDLEGLARHSGSAFGKDLSQKQLPQSTFENSLGLELLKRPSRTLVLEDESRSVGRSRIPDPFYEKMIQAPLVVLQEELGNRIRFIWEDYVDTPIKQLGIESVSENLRCSLNSIQGKLGNLRFRSLNEQLRLALDSGDFTDHAKWIEPLLLEYYDPMYRFASERKQRRVLFSGRGNELKDFFLSELRR